MICASHGGQPPSVNMMRLTFPVASGVAVAFSAFPLEVPLEDFAALIEALEVLAELAALAETLPSALAALVLSSADFSVLVLPTLAALASALLGKRCEQGNVRFYVSLFITIERYHISCIETYVLEDDLALDDLALCTFSAFMEAESKRSSRN